MSEVRLFIADDHGVVIEGIRSALTGMEDYKIVGNATDGKKAIEEVSRLKPDIIIMDISMPHINGVEATKEIKSRFPEIRIIVYTMFSDREYVIELFKAGMDGYVLKQDPFSDLIRALEAVRSGGAFFSTMAPKVLAEHLQAIETSGSVASPSDLSSLSQRELEIFQLLADGCTIKDISRKLFISPKTVESHKYNIMAKLDLESMTELTKLAIKNNMITI